MLATTRIPIARASSTDRNAPLSAPTALVPAPLVQRVALVPLATVPAAAVEALLDAAFGADRHGRTAYRLRAGVDWIAPLSFGCVAGSTLLGSVQCWPLRLTTDTGVPHPLILLGPVAVDPGHQQQGLGQRLTRAAIAAADTWRAAPLVLIGDPEYYGRFGFDAAATAGWALPGPVERHRLLARTSAPLPTAGMLGPDREGSARFASPAAIA